MTRVPVRKPGKQEWIRVHPDPAFRLDTLLLKDEKERDEFFLIAPAFWADLAAEAKPYRLFTAINRQRIPFLWPIGLPGEDGRGNSWHESAMDNAERAMTTWIRSVADFSLKGYQCYRAVADLGEPEWPKEVVGPDASDQEKAESFRTVLKIAFRDGRVIDHEDHPVIRRLSGRS